MRAIIAIIAGTGMISLALGLVPGVDPIPLFLRIVIAAFGAIVILAGAYHLWLRLQRRRAYAGGRERRGTVRLFQPISEESGIAFLLFANSHSEWLMSVDAGSIAMVRDGLDQGCPATAYLGTDDRIYGLDIGSVKALPISVGTPYDRKTRERVEWAERKKAQWAARERKD